MIGVLGGRGKTGDAVLTALSDQGQDSKALGRTEFEDLESHLVGCDAVYLIAPNMMPGEAEYVARVLDAMKAAGVSRLGYHSVAAPFVPEMPHHLGKAQAELVVRTSGLDWTILQPCAYTQNFVPALRSGSELVVPYDLDQVFGLIDVVDVAEVAARTLLDDSFIGSTLELGGPALVSIRDLATAATAVLNREITARQITAVEWAQEFGQGLSKFERSWLMAMFEYYDSCGLPAGSVATRAVLAREPHSVADTLSRELG